MSVVRDLSHAYIYYKVRGLSHAAWLNSHKGIKGKHVGREQKVQREEQKSNNYRAAFGKENSAIS